ncbi:hypothetical protein F4810DRAFT_658891 [Camillea tinctor]|nr:hypothetical protein F4810DRAFT_658891 [Camillea tinctor]
MILELLIRDGCSVAGFATISREWQAIVEPSNFSRIKLTPQRLADFGSIIHRNRSLVKHISLRLKLEEYNCVRCIPRNPIGWVVNHKDNMLISTVFEKLLSTLSAWEPNDDLTLNITVHSPIDSNPLFDSITALSGGLYGRNQPVERDDHQHGWDAAYQGFGLGDIAFEAIFEDIALRRQFMNAEQENKWWQQLPAVPAVTRVILCQENRRQWRPTTLARMLPHFPRLQEIHYEPWWKSYRVIDERAGKDYQSLVESFASIGSLRKLVLFEDFNFESKVYTNEPLQKANRLVSLKTAEASLQLEHLWASFIVDASLFFPFAAAEPSRTWPNLTSLALTSRLLKPTENPAKINEMLQVAAEAAMKMPKLETMELWYVGEGFAGLFGYQSRPRSREPAAITWGGTWKVILEPSVIRAWEAVALKHGNRRFTVSTNC